MDFRAWWHERTDGVEGIDKLIGEPGSMFRQHVIVPAAWVIVTGVTVWALWPRRGHG